MARLSFLRPNHYTSHLSPVECNSSPRNLAEIALNHRNDHTNSKVEHVASIVHMQR